MFVLVYALLVCVVIASFNRHTKHSDGRIPKKFTFTRLPHQSRPATAAGGGSGKDSSWKKQLEGVWLQYKEENFDDFLMFSGTSYALRKVIPVAFYMTRHTLSFKTKTKMINGVRMEEEYFSVKRDFGEGVREWTLEMKVGRDQRSAEPVRAVIDTDEEYEFQNWINESEQSISTLSTPITGSGVRCVQTRSLISPDEIRMAS